MKTKLFLLAVVILTTSCSIPKGDSVEKDRYSIKTIDSCEYIEVSWCPPDVIMATIP